VKRFKKDFQKETNVDIGDLKLFKGQRKQMMFHSPKKDLTEIPMKQLKIIAPVEIIIKDIQAFHQIIEKGMQEKGRKKQKIKILK